MEESFKEIPSLVLDLANDSVFLLGGCSFRKLGKRIQDVLDVMVIRYKIVISWLVLERMVYIGFPDVVVNLSAIWMSNRFLSVHTSNK